MKSDLTWQNFDGRKAVRMTSESCHLSTHHPQHIRLHSHATYAQNRIYYAHARVIAPNHRNTKPRCSVQHMRFRPQTALLSIIPFLSMSRPSPSYDLLQYRPHRTHNSNKADMATNNHLRKASLADRGATTCIQPLEAS